MRLAVWCACGVTVCCLFPSFLVAQDDCNGNSTPDIDDVMSAHSEDCNGNSIPDECEFAPLTFGANLRLRVGATARDLVAGDFDDDGALDMAVSYLGGLTVFFNRGGGDFDTRSYEFEVRSNLWGGGDFDGDGVIDLVGAFVDGVRLLINSGGDFEVAAFVPYENLLGLGVGDLDGDDLDDVVLTDQSDDLVLVLMSQPGGGLSEPVSYPVGDLPVRLALGDVDADGDLDAVSANQTSNDFTVLANVGDGTFEVVATTPVGGIHPESVGIADLTGDGLPEIVVGDDYVRTFVNRGNFEFSPLDPFWVNSKWVAKLDFGDFDADGDVDVLAGTRTPGGTYVMFNDGAGALRARQDIAGKIGAIATAQGDFDGDDDKDLVIIGRGHTFATVEWNGDAERAHFVSLESQEPVTIRQEPHSGALADVDGDGDQDLLVIDGTTSLYYLPNDGEGNFQSPTRDQIFRTNANALFSMAVSDLNGDGHLDVAAMSDSERQIYVLLGDGRGSFTRTSSYSVGAGPVYVRAVDTTGDGLDDLVTANRDNNSISLLVNRGGDGFENAETIRVGSGPASLLGTDADGDGDQDLIVACGGSSQLNVLLNRGDGRSFERFDLDTLGARFAAVDDFDGDDDLDLVSGGGGSLSFFQGDGAGNFALVNTTSIQSSIHSLVTGDVNGDGRVDVVTANSANGTLSVVVNLGDGRFELVRDVVVGLGPRFAVIGDLDGDTDRDLVSLNHDTLDITVVENQFISRSGVTYLEGVCTPADFLSISIPSAQGGGVQRLTKYLLPADPDDPQLLPPLFHNVARYPLHQQFLAAEFSDRFAVEFYSQLVGDRATRRYFSGAVFLLATPTGPLYGYNVLTNFDADPRELPTFEEVTAIHQQMLEAVTLRPLKYYPDARITRDHAATWPDTSFVYFESERPEVTFQAYTQGVGFGRVRVHTRASFEAANASGSISFQDILVLDHAPRDIEGVVGGVVTAEPQSDLSHIAVRTARRGTPNAFVREAARAFGPHDGELVRFEVRADDFNVDAATVAEAEAWWAESRPELSVLPEIDPDYQGLDRLEEIANHMDGALLESRFGGKASNLARLQAILDGPLGQYREVGFAIPVHYYLQFLRTGQIPSARDAAVLLTYDEYIDEVIAWPEFESDSQLRFTVLKQLRDHMRENGAVDAELVSALASRIESVFGSRDTVVRFRSSSNAEDALEFNGAGLYDSTSVCVLDDFDGDSSGPSLCDPTKKNERTIVRALKKVWASNWNFRAYEERAFFGMPQASTAMGLLVSRAFLDESANGVAFTGNPDQPLDNRYIVTGQVGEESVVSPEPGVVAEKNLLRVEDGVVVEIFRALPSTLVAAGETVLSDAQLREIGALLWHIDRDFPVTLGDYPRRQVLLDIEFKIESNGDLAVKQVRPFLRSSSVPPAPTFELDIPPGTVSCGVFVHSRSPQESLRLKSRVEFASGIHALPTETDAFFGELFADVRVGYEEGLAIPDGPGMFRWSAIPQGDAVRYLFRFEQDFRLPNGELYTLRLQNLEFRARGEQSLDSPLRFDEEFLTRSLALEGDRGLVARYSSCTYQTLPLWQVDVSAASGEHFRLLQRFEPPTDPTATGPASLVFADLDFGGDRKRQVIRYWDLVYGAIRHNRDVRYWAVLDPPVSLESLSEPVHVVEIVSGEPDLGIAAAVNYLGDDFQILGSLNGVSLTGELVESNGDDTRFIRGDVNSDGELNLSDAIDLVGQLFRGAPATECWKSADVDDDGIVDLADPIRLLLHLYAGAGPLAEPFGRCATDATPDSVPCLSHAICSADG